MIDTHTMELIVANVRDAAGSGRELRAKAMRLLGELPHFDWTGVYRLEGDNLILDEYVGAETDHVEIPVGRGVCGTAVATNSNQIVEDVRNLDNYLACSLETRSEIVVLVRGAGGTVLGQIDVDGHNVGAFDHSDELLLTRVAELLARRW